MSDADLNAIADRRRGSTPDIAAAQEQVREALEWAGGEGYMEIDAADTALATIEAHIAEIERERDDYKVRWKASQWNHEFTTRKWGEAERSVEALETALREIVEIGETRDVLVARAALNEEPYADVPGAGQRGC